MKTLKSFIGQSHLPESLIRSVIRQMGGWESFKDSASDITDHGANCGFSGFIYYTDTVPFANRNKAEILETLEQLANDLGETDAFTAIAGFNCINDLSAGQVAKAVYVSKDENHAEVMNALAWYALEEVARSYTDLCE